MDKKIPKVKQTNTYDPNKPPGLNNIPPQPRLQRCNALGQKTDNMGNPLGPPLIPVYVQAHSKL